MEKENTENTKSTSKIVPMSNQSIYDPRRQPVYYADDEISLIDLWIVLVKRKKLFFGILLAILPIGLTATVVIPEEYSYKTSIEIGSRIVNGVVQPIESPETLLAKIQESYIPLIQSKYRQENQAFDKEFEIKARIPKGSQIIVLESKGIEETKGIYEDLQRSVVEEVKDDHRRVLEIIRNDLEASRNAAANKLDELKDQSILLVSREGRIDGMKMLLNKQIEEAKKDLDAAQKNRSRAVKEASSATKAMTLLMLDNEVHEQRKRLAGLEERLLMDMANSHDEYAKQIADNKRLQLNQQDTIAHLNSQLANLVETRALVPPMQSIKPIGLGSVSILAISFVLGIVIAVISAFIFEFITKANNQIRSNSTSANIDTNN